MKYILLFIAGIAVSFEIEAQQKTFTPSNAHAHNDYLQARPFYSAFNADFGSIEADIFPVNGYLCVAHSKREIKQELTLKKLYLEPLLKELAAQPSRRLKLLIDIKEDYTLSLELLFNEIKALVPYLSTQQKSRQLLILISGNRPPPGEYNNYPAYIFFDDDLKLAHTAEEWRRVGQVSLSFSRYCAWKGDGGTEPTKEDKEKLKKVVDSVQLAGKTIRFWAAPDNEASWILQTKLGVDLIGTDKIEELSAFLRKRSG